jgi:acetoin utilization deacetylase AcuC-like enzyme
MDVGLVYHSDYLKHDPGLHHPEHAGRLEAVLQALETSGRAQQLVHLTWDDDPQAWITQVHDARVLRLVEVASQRGRVALDPDTIVSRDSFNVALQAVAGTLAAADAVVRGEISQVFCAVRPPGHHAESHRSMGFCLFNNVAILARYLQRRHGLDNIMIIDWDVHHGNGTQHIFEDDPSVFYISTHQYPFYPGTGATGEHYADPLAHMQVTEAGYRRMTQVVKEIAATCSQQRIISVLEGGYNLAALARSVEAHIEELQRDH